MKVPARRLPLHILVEDLVGVGFVGLVEAYRHYDPAHRDRFDAFAHMRTRVPCRTSFARSNPLTRGLRSFATRMRDEAARLEGVIDALTSLRDRVEVAATPARG